MTKKVTKRWRDTLALIPGYDCFGTAAPGDWFDEAEADFRVGFFHDCLKHVKGEKAGEPFILEPWEQAITGALFGWKRADSTRRYRTVFIFVGRKNGKTVYSAGLIVCVLGCDHEPGAEIYGAAAEYKQGCLVWDHAVGMVQQESELKSRIKIYDGQQKRMVLPDERSRYEVLTYDKMAAHKHGYNAHCYVIDELHTQPDAALVDVLETSTGARREPLGIYITTSDYERPGSVCNEKHDYACRVRDGEIEDSAFLPVIYEASPNDDWHDPETWKKANPNLGVSISMDYLQRAHAQAVAEPRRENPFKRLHLNLRTESVERLIPKRIWDLNDGDLDWEQYHGRMCTGGLDLGATSDLTSLCLVFPRAAEPGKTAGYDAFWWHWAPRVGAVDRERKHRGSQYVTWARQGWLKLTRGNRTDYDMVRADIQALAKQVSIQSIGMDPKFQGGQLGNQLQDKDGLTIVEFGQGFKSMASPAAEFLGLLKDGQFRHGNNPLVRWQSAHTMGKYDEAGNVKPDKKESGMKIDAIVSAIMAVGMAMGCEWEGKKQPSMTVI